MQNDLKMVALAECPEHIPLLAGWFVAEWQPYYGHDAIEDLNACCNVDTLPLALVALDGANHPVGTAALRSDSVGSELAPGPWLTGFLVHPDHRNRGIGARLIAVIEDRAARLGLAAIYVTTDAAEGIIERRGWQRIGAAQSLRGEVSVYGLDVGAPGPSG